MRITYAQALVENADLKRRLDEAEEVIRAIRTGAVDAFVVEEADGNRIYTLDSADRPYRLLVEQMQQGAVTLSADGAVAYCNRRFADLLDTPRAKLMGIDFRTFLPASELSIYATLISQAATGGAQSEAHLQRTDGRSIPVFLTFNALPLESGVAFGVLVTDLTTQRHQEQLDVAMSALEESDRQKNEFLAMLAHELRNPLAPISNVVNIMRRTAGNATVTASTSAMMERQVGQMVRLIDDLLDVSRVSRGQIELRKERIDLAAAITHAVDASRADMESSKHVLTVSMPSGPVYIDGDSARIAQIVGNLLNNARKFTDQGGRIEITLAQQGNKAIITVLDNGIGMDAGHLLRIFELFSQLDSSLERSVSGLGIGLTLVRKLVEMHGGSVDAFSAGVGHGSELVVNLPVAMPLNAQQTEPVLVKAIVSARRRILVVDDNRDSALSLAMLLDLLGHDTQRAYDGLEAMELAEAFRPDVIVLDIGLPKLNGYAVCKRLREQDWGKSITVIGLSGWGRDEDREMSTEAGFNAHLIKPVDIDSLTKLLVNETSESGLKNALS